uniref:Uncharacterized protein n=1 Tax=Oryzias latipes TaxID=8090 RepID=A0A3B3HN57_ORYLA
MGSGTVMSWPFSRRHVTCAAASGRGAPLRKRAGGRVLTSDLPRRSLLEMSKVSPTAAVSTPPVPRFCSRRLSRILEKRGSCRAVGLSHTSGNYLERQISTMCHSTEEPDSPG